MNESKKNLTQQELDDRDDRLMAMMYANTSEDIEGEIIEALEKSKPSLASIFKNKAKINKLLNSPDLQVDEGELLMYACRRGDLDIIKKTFSVIKSNDFKMAFQGACYGNHQNVMNWLIKKAVAMQKIDIQRAELLEAPPRKLAEIKKKKYIDIEDGLYGATAGGRLELCKKFIKMGAKDKLGAVRAAWSEVTTPVLRYLYQGYKFPLVEADIQVLCESKNADALKFMVVENDHILTQTAPLVLIYSVEWGAMFTWSIQVMKRYNIPLEMNIRLLTEFKKRMPKSIDMFIKNCTKESLAKYIDLGSISKDQDFNAAVKNRIMRK